ncbi:glycosyltransferase family 4 protein [Vibrio sp. RE86]|uniref:glycosyltransferase n=1 Tax=Vibrio sp. RE86 TaxID=2607605 RepID=UPI001493D71E|nr:glycosyltransferase [Vibrio sp. RE86]NOH80809.1 glycosyltransferase family 4 protein [Vibrio sp. RE86]
MHVWLVKLEEPIPTDKGFRPYRMSMLADSLIEAGNTVTRWCSDFDHLNNKARCGKSNTYRVSDSYLIKSVHASIPYTKPVSARRFINNFLIYHNFMVAAKKSPKPDLIVCSMPTPAMAEACSKIAKYFDIPLVLDARDMWPDIIEDELHGWKSFAAKPIIFSMKRSLKKACMAATSCVGITDFYKDFLLKYAGRQASSLDAVFELGYHKDILTLNDDELREVELFWKKKGVIFSGDSKFIYFAGRLNSTVLNVFSVVVDAAKILATSHPNLKFVICGSGQYADEIKRLSTGSKNIIFPGEISSRELTVLRDNSYVAIQPIEKRTDYQNSLSNKFFEYISSGLPILTWLDGLSERMVSEYKCGYRYSSPDELAFYLAKLMDDGDIYNRMSRNAKSLFTEKYSSKVIYSSFSTHLEKVHQQFMTRKLNTKSD